MESRTRYGLARIRWLLWNFLYLCVVGPVRVSTKDQNPDLQRVEISSWAKANGIEEVTGATLQRYPMYHGGFRKVPHISGLARFSPPRF